MHITRILKRDFVRFRHSSPTGQFPPITATSLTPAFISVLLRSFSLAKTHVIPAGSTFSHGPRVVAFKLFLVLVCLKPTTIWVVVAGTLEAVRTHIEGHRSRLVAFDTEEKVAVFVLAVSLAAPQMVITWEDPTPFAPIVRYFSKSPTNVTHELVWFGPQPPWVWTFERSRFSQVWIERSRFSQVRIGDETLVHAIQTNLDGQRKVLHVRRKNHIHPSPRHHARTTQTPESPWRRCQRQPRMIDLPISHLHRRHDRARRR